MRARERLNAPGELRGEFAGSSRVLRKVCCAIAWNAGERVLDAMIELFHQQLLGLARPDLRGDIAKMTDDPETAVRQGESIEAPLVVLGGVAIDAVRGALGREVWLAGLHGVPEACARFVGVVLLPKHMGDLVEGAADQIGMSPKTGTATGLTSRMRNSESTSRCPAAID
jgi:hypothetical protein